MMTGWLPVETVLPRVKLSWEASTPSYRLVNGLSGLFKGCKHQFRAFALIVSTNRPKLVRDRLKREVNPNYRRLWEYRSIHGLNFLGCFQPNRVTP